MEFRVLDEIVEIEGKGLMLFAAAEDCQAMHGGCRIRDVRGNVHVVDKIDCHESFASLYIAGGNADYFNRLFRDILVDATLFVRCDSEDDR
ncbi:MAG: hypothetical protein JW811_01280 [Clostridiales bacterium]|nr:hypothetical protein [Clostridiales bacterium]